VEDQGRRGLQGGSPDLPTSANRVEGFAKTSKEDYGEIVDSIALLPKVDVVLLESVGERRPRHRLSYR
jgi:hypothetical protein